MQITSISIVPLLGEPDAPQEYTVAGYWYNDKQQHNTFSYTATGNVSIDDIVAKLTLASNL